MKVPNRLQRNSILVSGLVLLAGASGLFGQTTANQFVVPTTSLSFAWQVGTAPPASQTFRIYTAPASANYTATVTNGIGWLTIGCSTCGTSAVSGVLQLTGNSGVNGQDLTISVNPAALGVNPVPYSGAVTLTSGATNLVINVSLTVTGTPTITLNPNTIGVQSLEANRIQQIPITINSSSGQNGAINWQATLDQVPNSNWMSLSTVLAPTGTTTLLTINTPLITGTNLAVGTVRFTVFGSSPAQTITLPISVQINPAAQIQTSSTLVTFPYQPGFTLPGAKPVTITSSTSTVLTYTAQPTGAPNYFTLGTSTAPSNTTSLSGLQTPSTFYIQPNIAQLPANAPAGNYDTTIQVISSSGSTANITARIVVTNLNTLTTSQDFVNYGYSLGGTDLQPTSISVGSTSSQLAFTASAVFEPNAATFFTVSAPNPFSGYAVIVTPDMNVVRNLPAGTFLGKVRLVPANTGTPIEIPVGLSVTGSAQLTVDTFQPLPFEGVVGATQTQRSLTVRSTDPNAAQNFTVAVDYGTGPSNWLIVSPTAGTTGTNTAVLSYNVNPTAITSAGNYIATLVITPTGVASPVPIRVTIRYNVAGTTAITATPTRLDLTQVGTTPPAPQNVDVSSSATNLTYQAAVTGAGSDPVYVRIGGGSSFTIPGRLQLVFDSANLPPRAEPYVNNVTLVPSQSGFATVVVPVRLTVTAPSNLQVSPASLSFSFTTGGTGPSGQTVTLSATGAPIQFTASATTQQGSWLTVNPTNGGTNAAGGAPVTITVGVNPLGLTQGTYQGSVTLTPTNGISAPVTIPVSLTVSTPNPPNSLTVSNNASGLSRGVSPGEFITIKGRNMTPQTSLVFTAVPAPTSLGAVRVLFGDIAAPVLYVGPSGDRSSDQINAIVPYGISGRATVNMVVEYQGVQSAPVTLTVRDTEPGIFTANSTGSGPAALLNQDNSYNTQANPAAVGSVIQIYGTGEGLIVPNPGEGRTVPATLPFPSLLNGPVSVRVQGRTAQVVYAGAAPGLLAGVFQINAVVPADLGLTGTSAQAALEVTIGSTNAQPGVSLWVRP